MGQVVVDMNEARRIQEAIDRPKPRGTVLEFARRMHDKLRTEFPGLILEIREVDTHGYGDIAYDIIVKNKLEEIKSFLADEELRLGIEQGILVINFVSDKA